jgi:hypothetical protein
MRRLGITITVIGGVLLAAAGAAPAARHHRPGNHHRPGSVRSVSNPPAQVPGKLKLKVGTSLPAVSVYASPGPTLMKGAVRLARGAKVRRHRLSVVVPGKLASGIWFVVVCPPTSHRHCASSHNTMAKLSTVLSAPLEASPVPETTQAATATIGSAGGALDATAADGTQFHLVIPAQAVPDGTQVTMTPISSLGAVGSARFVAGVQLAPEGLVLIHAGTLTITPSHAVPIAGQIAYGYDGTGDDVHQVPLAPTHAVVIPVDHFSGLGLLDAAAQAAEQALHSSGSTILDHYSALIGNEMWLVRNGYVSLDTAVADTQRLLQQALADLNAQEVPPGLNDDDAALKAIKDLLTLAGVSGLLGDKSGSMFAAVKPTVLKLHEGIYNRAQQKCANNDDLTQIPKIIDTDRSEELLLSSNDLYHGLEADYRCLRFQVQFDSLITVQAGSGGSGSWNLEYKAQPTVTVDLSGLPVVTGSAPGTYATASGTITGSDGTTVTVQSGQGDTFTVKDLDLTVDPKHPVAPAITLTLGSPSETYMFNDPSGPDSGTYQDHQWLHGFGEFHPPQGNSVVLSLQQIQGDGALVARGTFNNTAPDGSVTEATTVDVFHRPAG